MIQSSSLRPLRAFPALAQTLPQLAPIQTSSSSSASSTSSAKSTQQTSQGRVPLPLDALAQQARAGIVRGGLMNDLLANPRITQITNPIAQQLLKKPPFPPTDINMFTPQAYPGAKPLQPASPRSFSDSQLRSMLNTTFTNRFDGKTTQVNQAMNLYNDATLKQIVPDPRLRTALVSLKGTAGESAIDAVRSGVYQSVRFGEPLTTGANGEVVFPSPTAKPEIIINQKYQYEDPRIVGPLIAHETLHQDRTVTNKEEMLAHSLDTMVYGQVILENPALARSGTELARRQNTKLMTRLNSRDANGNLRLTTAQGNVLPGGTPTANFAAPFQPLGADTPGNANLNAMVSKVTGGKTSSGFSTNTVNLLDQNQKLFNPSQVVGLAAILKLKVM